MKRPYAQGKDCRLFLKYYEHGEAQTCDAPKQTLVKQAEQRARSVPCGFLSFKRSAFKKSAGI